MLFPASTSLVLIIFAALSVTASPFPAPAPTPEPIPGPAPIPPELQPIIAAKNNLAGIAAVRISPVFLESLLMAIPV
ncbi:hypothetical protein C0995_013278 [Termitomyces sp. Mi166|nr:hypothetical protein C0995_013278 [Termitomyces sp. Mi166\